METITTRAWTVRDEPVDGATASALLRDYYTDIVGRYHGRPAETAEVDAVLEEEPSDDLRPPTGLFLVGWYDGEPAGCVGLRLGDLPVAEITRVYVRPSARRQGGGARLLDAVEAAAVAYGATTVRLDTRHDLVEARGLYARQGYREVAAFSVSPYADHWFEKRLRG
ncbi:GNAT family N-acetyltransferase [Plantactinospora soyae]|uniref:Ribosomal protein S18 acetylase RimI-like enzyme n=1 Tax=Plantactinospora soyae TaxID=1544732 RepID=A0A927M9F8_9ACTN|nr:GNAT family N-acetyltransferase [Plantactinospora soyae]MBE1490447.1 ribosomal protein S18 acetylase RimI-like enzyme [Plantactinospora soyae]